MKAAVKLGGTAELFGPFYRDWMALFVSIYAQKAWALTTKYPTGIPLCPKSVGLNIERRD
jgi:hypothetical protein